jgi:hypothetical protein
MCKDKNWQINGDATAEPKMGKISCSVTKLNEDDVSEYLNALSNKTLLQAENTLGFDTYQYWYSGLDGSETFGELKFITAYKVSVASYTASNYGFVYWYLSTSFTRLEPATRTVSLGDFADACHFTISPNASQDVSDGDSVTYRIVPDDDYSVDSGSSVSVNGTTIDCSAGAFEVKYEYLSDSEDDNVVDLSGISVSSGNTPVNDRQNFFTIYKPSDSDITSVNQAIFIGSDGSSVDISSYFYSYRKHFVTFPVSGSKTLKAGNWNFGVTTPYLDYTKYVVDCGRIMVDEVAESLVDYTPFTSGVLYVPFVGFEDIDVNKIMNHEIGLKYHLDVVSGKCLVELVNVYGDSEVVIDQFAGTMAIEYPLKFTSADGNEGAYNLLSTQVMGGLTPYLMLFTKGIVDGGGSELEGSPTDAVMTVEDCSGYVKFSSIETKGCSASGGELDSIKDLLTSGIYV